MKKLIIIVSLLATAIFALVTSCDVGPTVNPSTEINENVRALAKPSQSAYAGDVRQSVAEAAADPEGCIVYDFKVNLGFTDLPCFNPSTTLIWPGALIDGASIVNGTYRPIIEDRKPLTISCSIANTSESVSKSVDKPSLSSMRDAINEIVWKNRTAPIPAMIDYKFLSIYSKEHLKVELGINANASATSIFGSIGGSLENRYDWESTTQKTRLLVKFVQAYYSCDLDVPASPVDFFTDSVKWDDLKNQITTGITPGYVSSIKYGRILLFFMQTEKTEWEVKDAFTAALNISCFGVTAGGSTTLTTQQQQVFEKTQISAIILGGDSSTATPVLVNIGNLGNYLTSGLNASANTPVVPLSYQVNYMSDNTWMVLVLGTEGQYRDCDPTTPEPTTEPTPAPTPATTQKTVSFTSVGTHTWNLPVNAASETIRIDIVGGGGGGSGSTCDDSSIDCKGDYGYPGQYITNPAYVVNKSITYRIIIGSGGMGGRSNGTNGLPGERSAFEIASSGSIIAALGGYGGIPHSSNNNYSSGFPGGYGNGGSGGDDHDGSSGRSGACIITYTAYVQ
jgi:hypothetical protein